MKFMMFQSLEQELTQIERSLWTNDAALYEATYLPDAVLIFPDVGRIGLDAAVAAIREENAASKTLCATMYLKKDAGWRVAFHQQTLA